MFKSRYAIFLKLLFCINIYDWAVKLFNCEISTFLNFGYKLLMKYLIFDMDKVLFWQIYHNELMFNNILWLYFQLNCVEIIFCCHWNNVKLYLTWYV